MATNLKTVILGDGATGKTCMLIRWTNDMFPTEYIPTVFDNYSQHVTYKDSLYSVGLWDTAGGEDYDRLRPLSYPGTDGFIILFSVVNPASFANIETKWVPEIQHHMPTVPFLIVGSKTDLREDPTVIDSLQTRQGRGPIEYPEGQHLAERLGGSYMEISSLRGEGVRELFLEFVAMCAAGIKSRRPQREIKRNVLCTLL